MSDKDSDESASALSERESNDEEQESLAPPIASIEVPASSDTPCTNQDSQDQYNEGAQTILDVVAKRAQLARQDIESGNRIETAILEGEEKKQSVAVGIPTRDPSCASSKVGAAAIVSATQESQKEAQARETTLVRESTKNSRTLSTGQSSPSFFQNTSIGGQMGGDIDEEILQRTRAEQPGAHAMTNVNGGGVNLAENERQAAMNEANGDDDNETYFPAVLVEDNCIAVENGSTVAVTLQSNGIINPQAIIESNGPSADGSIQEHAMIEGETEAQAGTGGKTKFMLCGIAGMVVVIVILILGLAGVFNEIGSDNSLGCNSTDNPTRPLSTLELIKENQVLRCSYTEVIVTDFEKALVSLMRV